MAMTTLNAWLNAPPDPPPAPAPKPATTAFQRTLAQQLASAREAPEPPQPRPASAARQARQTAPAAPRQGREAEARAASGPERQNAQAGTPSPGAHDVFSWGGGGGGGRGRDGGEQGGGRQGELAGAGLPGAVAELDFDWHLLLKLLPGGGESGIFELLLPGGERLAVVADITRRQASFLLTPSSERLRQQINKRKTELEQDLGQLMDRHVRLTVL